MSAMLVFQNNETAAILVFQTKSEGPGLILLSKFLWVLIFAIFPVIRNNNFTQLKINANIFPAKIYSRVNIFQLKFATQKYSTKKWCLFNYNLSLSFRNSVGAFTNKTSAAIQLLLIGFMIFPEKPHKRRVYGIWISFMHILSSIKKDLPK